MSSHRFRNHRAPRVERGYTVFRRYDGTFVICKGELYFAKDRRGVELLLEHLPKVPQTEPPAWRQQQLEFEEPISTTTNSTKDSQ